MKTPDWNDLKLGTIVVLNSLSRPINFWYKESGAQCHHFKLLTPPSYLWNGFSYKSTMGSYCLLIKNYAGMQWVSENSLWKIHPHVHNAGQVKMWNGNSVTFCTTVGPSHDVIQSSFAFWVGLDLRLHGVHILVLNICFLMDSAEWQCELVFCWRHML